MRRPHTAAALLLVLLGMTACTPPIEGDGGLLIRFQYLGCKGDWNDDTLSPEVFRTASGTSTTLLVRNAASCGYDVASKPEAAWNGKSLALRYTLDSDGGDMAACMCEYRARFEVATPLDAFKDVSVNGQDARVREGARFP